jgi:hypothetical protein
MTFIHWLGLEPARVGVERVCTVDTLVLSTAAKTA